MRCSVRLFLAISVAFSVALAASLSVADTIFESGTLGPTEVTWQQALDGEVQGSSIDSVVFSGVRFEMTNPVVISQVGGHVFSPNGGDFFGAVVALDNENDFPDSGDLSTPDVLGTTLLNFPVNSEEAFGDLSLSLDPGWYALVFGSGLFGATGYGGMPLNNPDIGEPIYIAYQPGPGWFNLSDLSDVVDFVDFHFVVEGHIVPEPATTTILLVILLALLHRGRCVVTR